MKQTERKQGLSADPFSGRAREAFAYGVLFQNLKDLTVRFGL